MYSLIFPCFIITFIEFINDYERFGISREEQDLFALRSQEKYAAALKAGYFLNEITPIKVSLINIKLQYTYVD